MAGQCSRLAADPRPVGRRAVSKDAHKRGLTPICAQFPPFRAPFHLYLPPPTVVGPRSLTRCENRWFDLRLKASVTVTLPICLFHAVCVCFSLFLSFSLSFFLSFFFSFFFFFFLFSRLFLSPFCFSPALTLHICLSLSASLSLAFFVFILLLCLSQCLSAPSHPTPCLSVFLSLSLSPRSLSCKEVWRVTADYEQI